MNLKRSHIITTIVILLIFAVVIFLYVVNNERENQNPSVSLAQYLATLGVKTARTTTATSTTPTTRPAINSTPSSIGTANVPASKPFMYALSPAQGTPGLTIIITGYGFDHAVNYINFGSNDGRHSVNGLPDNVIAESGSNDGKTLIFNVPYNGPNGLLCDSTGKNCTAVEPVVLSPGSYPVTVSSRGGISNTLYFTITR